MLHKKTSAALVIQDTVRKHIDDKVTELGMLLSTLNDPESDVRLNYADFIRDLEAACLNPNLFKKLLRNFQKQAKVVIAATLLPEKDKKAIVKVVDQQPLEASSVILNFIFGSGGSLSACLSAVAYAQIEPKFKTGDREFDIRPSNPNIDRSFISAFNALVNNHITGVIWKELKGTNELIIRSEGDVKHLQAWTFIVEAILLAAVAIGIALVFAVSQYVNNRKYSQFSRSMHSIDDYLGKVLTVIKQVSQPQQRQSVTRPTAL